MVAPLEIPCCGDIASCGLRLHHKTDICLWKDPVAGRGLGEDGSKPG